MTNQPEPKPTTSVSETHPLVLEIFSKLLGKDLITYRANAPGSSTAYYETKEGEYGNIEEQAEHVEAWREIQQRLQVPDFKHDKKLKLSPKSLEAINRMGDQKE